MSISMRYLYAAFLAAALAVGQQNHEVGFSTIPPWPNDNQPPADLADTHFVYTDVKTGEYVISYPEGLGTPDRTNRRMTFRWEPANLVDPQVSVKMSKSPDGSVTYDYTVTNGPKGKRALRWFSIVAPSGDDTVKTSHPKWHADPPAMPGAAPQAGLKDGPELRVAANMGRFVSWVNQTQDPLLSGRSMSGFRLSSKFRPGVVTAYAHTGNVLATPVSLPLMKPEVDYRSTLTIGPKFDPRMDDAYVSSDYAFCVQRLVNAGRLSADSPFVKEALSLLNTIMEANKGMAINFSAKPANPTEAELAAALQLTFGK